MADACWGPVKTWYVEGGMPGSLIRVVARRGEKDPVAEPHDAWPEDMVLAEGGYARYQRFATEEGDAG